MIIKGFTITAGQKHATHLLRVDDNEHVELHELRNFISDDLHGAFKESQAIARGTKCKQHLFSCAFAPAESQKLSSDQFLYAIDKTEQALGLDGQPRAIVFHEKDGRRHAHCVWSRIDAQTMTARHLPHWKIKIGDVSRELHNEFGIEMPKGLQDRKERDPLNFSQAEAQMAKRHGEDPRAFKAVVQECWSACDSRKGFEAALSEKSLFLAQGDKRGFVVLDHNGTVHSLARTLGIKTKEVTAKLGVEPARSLADAKQRLSTGMGKEARARIQNARESFAKKQSSLKAIGAEITQLHRHERITLLARQRDQWNAATLERQARLPRGFKGMWAWITGASAKIKLENQAEAKAQAESQVREREEQGSRQREERRLLQERIQELRKAQAERLWSLWRELAPHFADRTASLSKPDAPSVRLGLKLDR